LAVHQTKLEKARSELELTVRERTAALSRANWELSREAKAREWAQQMLMEKSKKPPAGCRQQEPGRYYRSHEPTLHLPGQPAHAGGNSS
jgi:hypothetical protein